MKPTLLIAAALLCSQAAFADSATATLLSAADTTIAESSGVRSGDGSSGTMITGWLPRLGSRSRGLLRFDLTSIPTGAVVTSASLTVNVERDHTGIAEMHALQRLLTDWLENNATWDDSGLVGWSGGDFNLVPDATTLMGGSGAYTLASTTGLVATVQSWVNNSSANFGWVLRDQGELLHANARRFFTRESAGQEPRLVIHYDYTPPSPDPVTLLNLRVVDGNFSFDFQARIGTSYTVQFKESVDAMAWSTLATYPDPMADSVITVEDPLGLTQRFYRVISP